MKVKEQWLCNSCDELHDKKRDAEDCCAPVRVWVCGACDEAHDDKADAEACCADGWTGVLCLCGAHLQAEDERESLLLGDQVRCERCRAKILAGVPSGEAVRQSFVERGLAIR